MKKYLLAIILSIYTLVNISAATDKAKQDAVSMVSYEQGWLDYQGTIALKNNTTEKINSVTFLLEYLDMQGRPMDYETFSYAVDIEPGMTKKLDIPAYEHDRRYHYYKTKDEFGHPAFKLRYELKSYNSLDTRQSGSQKKPYESDIPVDDVLVEDVCLGNNDNYTDIDNLSGTHDRDDCEDVEMIVAAVIAVIFILGIYVGMYVLVAVMAKRRNRNPVLWLLLSFIATPLLICIILLAIGSELPPIYRDR